MPYSIYHDVVIRSSVDKVFKALTQPAHLINWWPLKCSGSPELGAEYNLHFGAKYDWFAEVSQIIPNEVFYLKMTKSDEDWSPTTFGYELIEVDDTTRLCFKHTDWRELNKHFRTASYCWALLLHGLKQYIESGKVIPFEQRS